MDAYIQTLTNSSTIALATFWNLTSYGNNSLNTSTVPPHPNVQLSIRDICQLVIHTILLIVGGTGNSLVLLTILKRRVLRNTIDWLIFNLSLSGLLMMLINIPLINLYYVSSWPFGEFLCKYFLSSVGECLIGVSVFTHTALSLVRYRVVIHPLKQEIQPTKIKLAIAIMWLVAFSTMSAPLTGIFVLQYSPVYDRVVCVPIWPSKAYRVVYRMLIFVLTFLLPMLVTAYCYAKLSVALRRSVRFLVHQAAASNDQVLRRQKRGTRLTWTLVVMYLVFALFTLPLQLFYIFLDLELVPQTALIWYVWLFLIALFYCQAASNPIVLLYMSEEYQSQAYILLKCKKSYKRNSAESNTGNKDTVDKLGVSSTSLRRRSGSGPIPPAKRSDNVQVPLQLLHP